MVKRMRGPFTGDEKMALWRRHLVEDEPISQVCEEAGI